MTQHLMLTLFTILVVIIVALIIYIIAYRRGFRWICPNCGQRQIGLSHQCPRCGVVFKEWKK